MRDPDLDNLVSIHEVRAERAAEYWAIPAGQFTKVLLKTIRLMFGKLKYIFFKSSLNWAFTKVV